MTKPRRLEKLAGPRCLETLSMQFCYCWSMLCSDYTGQLFVPTLKAIERSVNIYPLFDLSDRRGAGQHRSFSRNRAEITILMSKQKPQPVWFSHWPKSYPIYCEHGLICATHTKHIAIIHTRCNKYIEKHFHQFLGQILANPFASYCAEIVRADTTG